jgi:WD40 repeat protein
MAISALVLPPDGRFALSASYDHTLKLWNLQRARDDEALRSALADRHVVAIGLPINPAPERVHRSCGFGPLLEVRLFTVCGSRGGTFILDVGRSGDWPVARAVRDCP